MRESTDVKSVRAAAYTGGVATPVRRIDRIQRGTAEPPSVTLLRHLLNPTVIVVTLLLTAMAYGTPLSQQYLALAALAFLISAQVVSDPVLDSSGTRGFSMLLHHRIFSEWLLVSAALLLLAFALKVTELFSRRVILTWFAITPFVVVAAQVGFRRYAAFSALRGKILQSHVIVGANDVGARLARRLRANPHLGTFRGFFDDRRGERLPELPEEQLLGGTADIANYVRWNSVSSIYICLPMRPDERVMRLLEELKDTTASVYFVPDLYAFDTMQAQVCDLDGIPLFAVRETPFNGMNGVLKRGSDIVFATILLLMIWPLLLALAIGVRLSSPGPVLFRQRRYGLYGE
ncbi:MAG TPA: sugar transferase, partial [Steroidobacteraceae bacterium]|nr:sugar transferase [Steroidobacteraceae bacterium]